MSFWDKLIDDPLALFTAALALVTAIVAIAAIVQSTLIHRQRVDAESPRVAFSLDNVGWPPQAATRHGRGDLPPRSAWDAVEIDAADPTSQPAGSYWATHTVGRIRNDGAATAYVNVEVSGEADAPCWYYSGEGDIRSPLFRVSTREFTLAPREQVELDLYPGLPAECWASSTVTEICWKISVGSRLPTRVLDRCELVWSISDHFDSDGGRLRREPTTRAVVKPWSRRYRRWRGR